MHDVCWKVSFEALKDDICMPVECDCHSCFILYMLLLVALKHAWEYDFLPGTVDVECCLSIF